MVTNLLSLQHGLPLLPSLVKSKKRSGTIHPLDQSGPGSQGRDGVVASVKTRLLLLVDFGEHGVDDGQELHDALIQVQILQA